MNLLVALGGNALEDGSAPTAENQLKVIKSAVKRLTDLVEAGHELVISHGNGPQVGRVLLQNEAAKELTPPLPLDVCGAMTQGAIGYQIQQAMQSELAARNLKKPVVSMVTQVGVNAADPGFNNPTKPVGIFYSKEEVEKLKAADPSIVVKEDAGRGWRRVVASPKPEFIQEIEPIRTLVKSGCVVVACGGGGIPVIKDGEGVKGAIAVIDKDFASELLAEELDADTLIVLTGVDQVCLNYNKPNQKNLSQMTVKEAEQYIGENQFAPGSMLPKVQAAVQFVRSKKGRKALITSLEQVAHALKGQNGTWVVD